MPRVSLFNAKGKTKAERNRQSFLPQKMFEAKTIESFARFARACPPRGRQFFVNGSSGVPFCIRFEQLPGIKPCLVKPKKFMRPIRSRSFIDNRIESGKRGGAVRFF